MRHRLLPALALVMSAAPLVAQGTSTRISPTVRRHIVTISPFLAVVGIISGDYEARIAPSLTLGGGGTLQTDNGESYGALEAKLRYYPDARALQGLSIAATAGVIAERYQEDIFIDPDRRVTDTRPTLGTEVSYQWIVGPVRDRDRHRREASPGQSRQRRQFGQLRQ